MTKQWKDRQLIWLDDFFQDVRLESFNQIKKWGIGEHSPDKWNTILGEEVGELAKAILEEKPDQIYTEAIQVATLALKIAEMAQEARR